jgi:hypothetical protein
LGKGCDSDYNRKIRAFFERCEAVSVDNGVKLRLRGGEDWKNR